ncbi:MAG TPA: DUF2637 domain-containing protein [Kineosporiaceae bacterium]
MLLSRPVPRPSAGRGYRRAAVVVLGLVAVIGAVLSWGSLYQAASVELGGSGPRYAGINVVGAAFPLLLDALILGASLRYVAGVKARRPVAGWRMAAHAAIAGTIVLNGAAADSPSNVPWHIVAPAVWSLIVELYARDVLGELREVRAHDAELIPLRLWLTAPGESIRTSWRMARTGERSAERARVAADRCAAACDALRRALPGLRHRRTRRQITRRVWAGSIDPADVFAAIGWLRASAAEGPVPADDVFRAALRSVVPPSAPRGSVLPSTEPGGPGVGYPGTGTWTVIEVSPPVAPGTTPPAAEAVPARPDDVARLRAAIAAGDLDRRPSQEAVRRHLRIGRRYAGAALTALRDEESGRAFAGTAPPVRPRTPTSARRRP